MTANLEPYRQKRDFTSTPEPFGSRKAGPGEQPRFVIQKHDASTLHYDFRLEYDGVLKSWAVPKEPGGMTANDRHLAIQTEDHPLDYVGFEGEIPAGEYGGGSVVIWDQGYWVPENDPAEGFPDGKLDFELHGTRMDGHWALVRFGKRNGRSDNQKNWLLIKRKDPIATNTKNNGNRLAAEMASARVDPGAVEGAKRGSMPIGVSPQLASLVDTAPSGSAWFNEPKLDGYRLLCCIDHGAVTLLTRNGNDWTNKFPTIAAQAAALPCQQAVIDGEAVVYDEAGVTDFQRLQSAIGQLDPAIVLVAFDLLYLDGWDLRNAALRDRKLVLHDLLKQSNPTIRYGDHVVGQGPEFFAQACVVGLEGIIAKKADDPYRETRTQSWRKIKCHQRQEFVIIGFTEPSGSRKGFGSLALGVRDEPGAPLRYVGKVGTGFSEETLQNLHRRLKGIERKKPAIPGLTARDVGKPVHWVDPQLVAEIVYREWTEDGHLRHASFQGLREDKPAAEVVEEIAVTPVIPAATGSVTFTSPDKVLFPEAGITKQELADYWTTVADYALPHMAYRPLALFRCPDGLESPCFYQKHVGVGIPAVVPKIDVEGDGEPYAMVDDLDAVIGLVQIEALELHQWGSRAEAIEQPDIIVFDLDPDETLGWDVVVAGAFDIKSRLEALGLVPFAKVTGGKGIHVVVPVQPGPEWPAIKQFSKAFVLEMVREQPDRYTASVSKSKRSGRIYIDYLRNGRGATAIAAYSPRARPGAPVAAPIGWDALEASGSVRPVFGVADAGTWMKLRGKDPWLAFEDSRRSLID